MIVIVNNLAKGLTITKYYYIFQDLLCDDSLELDIPDFTLITEMFTTSLARLKEAIGANSVKSPSFGTLPKVEKIIRDLRVPKVRKRLRQLLISLNLSISDISLGIFWMVSYRELMILVEYHL